MLPMNEDLGRKCDLRSFSNRTFPMKPVPPVMKTTCRRNQWQVLLQMYDIIEDWLCPCRTPLLDCHPPFQRRTKDLPEFLLFLWRSWATSREVGLCYVAGRPVRSQLSSSEDQGCGIPSWCSTTLLTGRQWTLRRRRCMHLASKVVVTGLSTRWQAGGSVHPFLTGAQLLSKPVKIRTGLGTSSTYWPAGPL